MDYKLYEKYVYEVARHLSIFKDAKVYTNRKYKGVRQPGNYEIDISFELFVDNALYYLTIVECKNWKTPVDRPQIQKLVQTRDAICAHKAAVASPVGYTKEAEEVAKANGVALWVIAEGKFEVVMGGGAAAREVSKKIASLIREQTGNFFGYNGSNSNGYDLIPFSWISTDIDVPRYPWYDYFLGELSFQYLKEGNDEMNYEPILQLVLKYTFDNLQMKNTVKRKIGDLYLEYLSIFIESGMDDHLAKEFLNEYVTKMVTTERTIPYRELVAFDRKLKHTNKTLLAPIEWLEKKGENYFIYTGPGTIEPVKLENNIIWANIIWLIHKNGRLK